MNFLLDATNASTLSERASEGFRMLIMGLGVVFCVLIIIWLLLEIFHLIVKRTTGMSDPVKNPSPAPVSAPTPKAKSATNDELIAVITAAIAASDSDIAKKGFRVVSFTRRR